MPLSFQEYDNLLNIDKYTVGVDKAATHEGLKSKTIILSDSIKPVKFI